MAYCSNCGDELVPHSAVCINCGAAVNQRKRTSENNTSVGYAILGFFFPIIGLILWLVWKDEYPRRAASAGKGALARVNLILLSAIILIIIWLSAPF